MSANKRLIDLAGVMAATAHQVLQISAYPQPRPKGAAVSGGTNRLAKFIFIVRTAT
ncbi:Unknown protein sequence [Pseudomonas syringae pv. cilantro]|uniref:Uncharacterized protein n=1 Tax=Pseudomonas syringae pv. cilantro TaxID=81035 RepID=A0A0N0XAQ4_PSESX|nr:Unknown protein sequence [Pseudomonas syringae pv. cilantro]